MIVYVQKSDDSKKGDEREGEGARGRLLQTGKKNFQHSLQQLTFDTATILNISTPESCCYVASKFIKRLSVRKYYLITNFRKILNAVF